ncbi:MAG: hypothetical protein ACP5NK_00350 [Thermoplasmata archaeon]
MANIILLSISTVVFAVLLTSYARSYRNIRSSAFGGIMAFSSTLLAESMVAVVIYYNLSLRFSSDLAALLLVINAISLVGYLFLYRSLDI